MVTIDTNVILRYILNDIEEQVKKASQIINDGAQTYPEIIAEVVYVLTKLYSVPREEIDDILLPFLEEVEMIEKEIVKSALSIYAETKFDFVDSLLIARKSLNDEKIFTFDKKLANRLKTNI